MLSRLSLLAIAALGASVLLSAPTAKPKRRPAPFPAGDAFARLLAQSEPGSAAA